MFVFLNAGHLNFPSVDIVQELLQHLCVQLACLVRSFTIDLLIHYLYNKYKDIIHKSEEKQTSIWWILSLRGSPPDIKETNQ